jgi:hypothetical protein
MAVAALQVVGVVQWSRGEERVESGRAWACGLDKNRDWVGGGRVLTWSRAGLMR